MRTWPALLLLLALSGCATIYCGPGAGDRDAKDMIHAMCSEL